MKRIDALFALVRAGLWEETPPTGWSAIFEGATPEDWLSLYQMASSQALLGLCFDGLNRLSAAQRPERPLYLKWAAQVAKIEQLNQRLNAMAQRVITLAHTHGMHPVLLKGQAIAACYPRPLHRQCGDIDLFVGKTDAPRLVQLLVEAGAQKEHEESYKHSCVEWEGVHIEIHRMVGRLNAPAANRRMQRWVAQWFPAAIGQREAYPVPASDFELFFIFQHAFMHFLNSGVGLRQLCDWARLIHVQQGAVERDTFERQLRQMGLLRAAQAFAGLLVRGLHLPLEQIPFTLKRHPQLEAMLIDEILQTGNFGQWDRRIPPRPMGYWSGKWHTFTRALKRCLRLMRFAPAEALCYPFLLIENWLTVQSKRLIHPSS